MVKQAFATPPPLGPGIVLHLEIGNAVPETTCTDNTSTNPPQLCQFPNEPGVIGWKNSLEFSKVWPKNLASCAAGGDCSPRFPYGQKDSYHYVLFGHSLAIPAWNTRYQTLTAISVNSGVTTITTINRGPEGGINYCPSRITISGVLGNPTLNGVYNTTSCADSRTHYRGHSRRFQLELSEQHDAGARNWRDLRNGYEHLRVFRSGRRRFRSHAGTLGDDSEPGYEQARQRHCRHAVP